MTKRASPLSRSRADRQASTGGRCGQRSWTDLIARVAGDERRADDRDVSNSEKCKAKIEADVSPGGSLQARRGRRQFIRGAAAAAGATGFALTRLSEPADAAPLQNGVRQAAEGVSTLVFDVLPATSGVAPFEVYMNSYPNEGAGHGTYNRGMWFGWNGGHYAARTPGAATAGVYMGFEDHYYDAGGDETFGVEWYTGYTSPDATAVKPGDLRPLYWRVLESDTDTTTKSVFVLADIGSAGKGTFAVYGSVKSNQQLFAITNREIYARVPTRFTAPGGSIQVAPTTGYAQIELVAPGPGPGGHHGVIAWRDGSDPAWSIAGTTGSWAVRDAVNGDRAQVSLTPGPSDTTAQTTMHSNLSVKGKFGVNGATPKGKAAAIASPPEPSFAYSQAELKSMVEAVNDIRKVLSDVGLTHAETA